MADPAEPTELAAALRPSILRMARRLRRETEADDLSANDVILMGHIRKNPGIGVSGLADIERTSQPTISSQIKRLEAGGVVSRAADLGDARRSGLTLTPLGLRRLEAVRHKRNDWLAKRLAALAPEERARLAEAAAALLHLADAP